MKKLILAGYVFLCFSNLVVGIISPFIFLEPSYNQITATTKRYLLWFFLTILLSNCLVFFNRAFNYEKKNT